MAAERDVVYAITYAYSQFRDEEVTAGHREFLPVDEDWGNDGAFGAMVKIENHPLDKEQENTRGLDK